MIKVEQLFHNTPARRLFLKTDQTEANLIINLIKNFALAEREIRFELYSETKKIFSSPINQEWTDRINEIFFNNEHLLPVLFDNQDCKIEGAICDPNTGNPCKKFLSFFVNRRPIDSKLLRLAVNDALSPILPKHREIIACLLININPRFVDVNVHPTKREVRFRNEQFVRNSVIEAIQHALQNNTQIHPNVVNKLNDQYNQSNIKNNAYLKKTTPYNHPTYSKQTTVGPITSPQTIHHKQIFHDTKNFFQEPSQVSPSAHWKLIGTLFQDCAIFERDSGMVILNMKLATIKIVYEKLRKNTQSKNTQTLLFPIDFDVSAEEAEILDKISKFLAKEGLEIYTFGKNQYRIAGITEWLSVTDAEKMVKDLISSHTEHEIT
ncbi:MAG: DNA mismatch repair endonuclease MutL, partial [Opitutales bacterium]|nr:DNA mismatch repair endonuclease MutL [Opitutales bacterium]